MMNESTQKRSNIEMANELAKLGSQIQFGASGRFTTISVSSLKRNLDATLALLHEKLFFPAFLERDFNQLKQRSLQAMQQQIKSPNVLAQRVRDTILYGKNNRVSLPDSGTYSTLQAIELDDIRTFYERFYNPYMANMVVVGDITKAEAVAALDILKGWSPSPYEIPGFEPFPNFEQGNIYLVDKPGAVQSVISFAKRSMPYDATGEYFMARLMNFPLGGNFNSRINLNLREDKGYTYGAGSRFIGGKTLGTFSAGGDFNAVNTLESIQELLREMSEYRASGIQSDELEMLKKAYTQGDALDYETPGSKARFLGHLLVYGLDKDFTKRQLEIIENVTAEQLNDVARSLLDSESMQIFVVGDAQSLKPQLETLGRPVIEFEVDM
jgi:zinc protease